MAEAKHYLDKYKIKIKLRQFDTLQYVFNLSRNINSLLEQKKTLEELNIIPDFIRMVQTNKYLANISESTLYFGAAFWEKNILNEKIENDIKKRENLVSQFLNEENRDIKISLYRKTCQLDERWYEPGEAPNNIDLEEDKILELEDIPGAIAHVRFIYPSGDNFRIEEPNKIMGISNIALGGKRR